MILSVGASATSTTTITTATTTTTIAIRTGVLGILARSCKLSLGLGLSVEGSGRRDEESGLRGLVEDCREGMHSFCHQFPEQCDIVSILR